MADALDILGNLLPLKFRGIEVPCQTNSIKVTQNLVEHNQYGVSGGEQENTCRKSAHLSFTIPFRAGLLGYRNLYPNTYRDFWNACCDRSTGPLQHPEFGLMDVKVENYDTSWDPARRDGVDMTVSFVETIEKGLRIELTASSPIKYATGLALDAEKLGPGIKLPKYNDGSGSSLSDALKKLKGMQMLADITAAGMLAEIEKTMEAVNVLIDFTNQMSDPKAWPVMQALKGIETALVSAYDSAGLVDKKAIDIRTTTQERTTPLLAGDYGITIEQLFKLNPLLAAKDKVPAGTVVFIPQV
jgi:prophage DNA circulation protein